MSSFADTKEGRYNPKMHPVVPVNNWRKGSQVSALGTNYGCIIFMLAMSICRIIFVFQFFLAAWG